MKITIPSGAAAVIRALEQNGYEAYVVGGCVRDALMGREPNDWDVTTSARPEKTREIFDSMRGFKTYPTGMAHGTVTVLSKGEPIETTTFRIDGEYTDNRRPDRVEFTDSLREDLARRDFTINAMAYSDACGLCDPYGGTADLAAKVIRCVGDPEKRFSEDALRIMRAMRFSAVLGFRVDNDTAASAINLCDTLSRISRERICGELEKLLSGNDAARVIREFFPILCEIIPTLTSSDAAVICERIARLRGEDTPLMLAALLPDGCDSDAILKELRFSKRIVSRTGQILAHYCRSLPDKPAVRHLCREIGIEAARDAIRFGIACGVTEETVLLYIDEILRDGDCLSLSALRINGRILLAMGVPKREIGGMLNRLLERVMSDELQNRTTVLKKAVRAELKGLKKSNEGSTAL